MFQDCPNGKRGSLSRREFLRHGLRTSTGCAAFALAGCCPTPGQIATTSQAIDAAIQNAITQYQAPSASYALIVCGQIASAKAWGSAQLTQQGGASIQATTTTMYQAASLSKTIAAVAALMSVGGAFTLDADVTKFQTSWKLPAWGMQTAANPATLRRLLGMTVGANIWGFPGYAVNCVNASCTGPLPTLIDILNGSLPANNPPILVLTSPGTMWSYSGGGYEVVHSLLQDVSGNSYADFVEDRIFGELGMKQSTVLIPIPTGFHPNSFAWGYIGPQQVVPTFWNTYPELAAAGAWTTPSDLALLLLEISSALANKGKILSRTGAQAMMTQVDGSQYGLGGAVRNPGSDSLLFMKNGSNFGYTSWLAFYPNSGNGIVIFSNYDSGNNTNPQWTNVFESVASIAATSLNWPNFPGLQDSG